MSTQSIKEVVKEKYGQAALRVHTGGSSCCGASAALEVAAIPSPRISTMPPRRSRFRKKR